MRSDQKSKHFIYAFMQLPMNFYSLVSHTITHLFAHKLIGLLVSVHYRMKYVDMYIIVFNTRCNSVHNLNIK